MSEQPSTGSADRSRPRRPGSRFRDLPIWSKLGVIMIVPTLATVVVGTSGLVSNIDTAGNADRARVLANLSTASGELVHHLQDERAAAVMLLGAGNDEDRQAGYTASQEGVESNVRPYQQQRTSLADLPDNFRTLLNDIENRLVGLPQLRGQVTSGEIQLSSATLSYDQLITNLINIRDAAALLAQEPALSDRKRAAAAISRAKEALARQRVVGHEILIREAFPATLRNALIGAITSREQALETFDAVATNAERALHERTVAGADLRQSVLYESYLTQLEGDSLGRPPFDAAAWDDVMAAHASLLREVERELDAEVSTQALALRNDVTQRILVQTGLLLAMLLLAILLAWLVARSMARSLRELRQGALAVAQYGLPQAVARLRDPALSTQLSPAQVAGQIAEPLPVRSRDEFGQVTEAFNAVHLEAVRTAAEQAALRSSVSTMFVNLARRSQILVDRLIGHLDRLERGEEDPDRLAELFQLDHLATRMRRNDENLLILAGADSTRVQREPAALIDVLRAAQSEVEHYTRIEFGVVDRDIEVAAHAVNDLVHLVAELFDNATAFSPPESHVVVEARRVGDRAVLYVEDHGIGMSHEQLAEVNERLATPPLVDVAVSRMMGLVVVARLAARHGVKVELRRAPERGTIADVTLPTAVLVPRALSGRLGGPMGDMPPTREPANAPPRSPLGAPLALESGPSAYQSAPAAPPSPPRSGGNGALPPPQPARAGQGGGTWDDPARRVWEELSRDGHSAAPPAPGRSMPAWSDLTGAGGPNGAGPGAGTGPVRPSAPPLPQRRPSEPRTVDGEVAGDPPPPPLPRQRPAGPVPTGSTGRDEVRDMPAAAPAPPGVPDRDVMPGPGSRPEPPDHDGVTTPPAAAPAAEVPKPAAPPVWPPVAPEPAKGRSAGTPGDAGVESPAPAVPGELAAALDMTAEIPKVSTAAPGPAPYQPPETPAPPAYGDQTMELPIFRELESAWFQTKRPPPASEATPAAAGRKPDGRDESGRDASGADLTGQTAEFAMASAPTTATAPAREASGPGGPDGGTPVEPVWRTAADDGWRAASAAAATPSTELTGSGLPKRRPMAQLVPGGVDRANTSTQRRSPEAVRGLLSAYHRGVQRGRTQPKDETNGSEATGSESAQAGKEQEA